MTASDRVARETPNVLSIPAGVPFLETLADAVLDGRLVEGVATRDDPLALAATTIYVPTRRAARALRSAFVDRLGGVSAILPTIRPLGEFEEDAGLFDGSEADELSLAPPIEPLDRILLMAPLVQAWKRRLPAHVAALFGEEVVVPASLSDALWLSRDLAGLMDEIETGGADWARLAGLVPEDLANWWQVTLEFLDIVTRAWPALLVERDRSNPAAHRNAMILAEAARLARTPPTGPMIAAGSTGSIPCDGATCWPAISRLSLRARSCCLGLDLRGSMSTKLGARFASDDSPPVELRPSAGRPEEAAWRVSRHRSITRCARSRPPLPTIAARIRGGQRIALRPAEDHRRVDPQSAIERIDPEDFRRRQPRSKRPMNARKRSR
jgi:ATP-dependent helicase/nuclease subunit B